MANELDRLLQGEDSASYGWDINSVSDIVSRSDMEAEERSQLDHIFSIDDIKQVLQNRLSKNQSNYHKGYNGPARATFHMPTQSVSTVVEDIMPQKGVVDQLSRHSLQTDETVAHDVRSKVEFKESRIDTVETQDAAVNTSDRTVQQKHAGIQTERSNFPTAENMRSAIGEPRAPSGEEGPEAEAFHEESGRPQQSTPRPTYFYRPSRATVTVPVPELQSDGSNSSRPYSSNSTQSRGTVRHAESAINPQNEWLELRVQELENQVRDMQETINNLRGSEPNILPDSMPDANKNIPESKKKYYKLEMDQIDEKTLSEAHNFIKKIVLLFEIPFSLIPETLCLIFDHLKDEDRYYGFAKSIHRILYNSEVPTDEITSDCLAKMRFEIERLHKTYRIKK
jgi:chaperonin cofactor prefoldin